MHRFVLGGYLLQTTKEDVAKYNKEGYCNVKGKVVDSGYAPYLGGLAQILGS